jgi:hypothetical protein
MAEMDDVVAKASVQANEVFAKLAATVEERLKAKATSLDVAEVARKAGLEVDARILQELQVDRIIFCHPWLPWHFWFPWRPLWCWWWHFHYPWYRCCPWWWYRCHWYPF